jgi:asparagine synthase (glutamine-hydrolysing)
MSVQFGQWNFDGQPVSRKYLEDAGKLTRDYAPNSATMFSRGNVAMAYQAFHTVPESWDEEQPLENSHGMVLTWDGRLDNRQDLLILLSLRPSLTDAQIVLAAFRQWGTKCFARLLGEWAAALWEPTKQMLFLAKDFAGTRPLFYSLESNRLVWSTVLDPLVLLTEKPLRTSEEYLAGYFALYPSVHLSPFEGINAVPAGTFLQFEASRLSAHTYWSFEPRHQIHLRSDAEYEEQFRALFTEAVRRRLRSDKPVLAELSGGMDSSSIVCVADEIISKGNAGCPRLDTLSYYDDSEPSWNERPFFTKVEEWRGKTGFHIDVSQYPKFSWEYQAGQFVSMPGTGHREMERLLAACLNANGNRAILSGIGGDEVLGGVPTPVPELANYLARGHLLRFAHQLVAWALARRQSLLSLWLELVGELLPHAANRKCQLVPPWLADSFVRRHPKALSGYNARLQLLGPLPSFQDNLGTLDALRRQLACSAIPSYPLYEKRYPYLDRDLLEFVYAIPREQLVRPHHRRSLMRRALTGIVPDEVLNRKRKGFLSRSIVAALAAEWPALDHLSHHMVSGSLGILDEKAFATALEAARHVRKEIPVVALMRTVAVEAWLRQLERLNRHSPPRAESERGSHGSRVNVACFRDG